MTHPEELIAIRERDEVRAKAAEIGSSVGLPGEALEKLVDYSGAISVISDSSGEGATAKKLNSYAAPIRVIIRDDLLEPVRCFLSLLKGCVSLSSAIAALFASGPNTMTIGAIASSIADLHDLFRKTAAVAHRLTPLQWAIIWELRLVERASVDTLAARLPQISPQDIEATLRHFMITDKVSKNFTQERDGLWELVGV